MADSVKSPRPPLLSTAEYHSKDEGGGGGSVG